LDKGENILEVRNLTVEFNTYGGIVKAVRGVDFNLERGKTLAIVGESGCGKSVTVQSIMGLIPMPPGRITAGSALLDGNEILGLKASALNQYRGRKVGMIFQDAMSSLNPTMRIGKQIAETLQVHRGMSQKDAVANAVALLGKTKIPEPEERAQQYPFEFSGGMLQRSMIAMSLACNPSILVADEPTTALDVTIQAQILELMKDLQASEGMSIILITHDLGVVARMADDVAVMYAGKICESGSSEDIFYRSAHPYTTGLRTAMPENNEASSRELIPIEGTPPDLFDPPKGCGYFARCPFALKVCEENDPGQYPVSDGHTSCCWLLDTQCPPAARAGLNRFSEEPI
jgi:oligopeptide/dipeptide ABC transporter ATP-binding protein